MMESPDKYRNEVVKKFMNIERIIDTLITQFYVGMAVAGNWFMLDVLYDERFSFGLKKKILEKILRRLGKYSNEKMRKLHRISEIRNYFVHREPFFMRPGGETAPDPKNTDKDIDFPKLYDEFVKKEKEVNNFLFEVLKGVGVKLMRGD